jgi:membrane fusion protein (multidrug efflux system)
MVKIKQQAVGGVAAAVLIISCGQETPRALPPPEVSTMVVKEQSAPNVVEVPGRVQAVRSAEVRARVDGIVQRRLYDEGSDVKEGQLLFQIDPRELLANVNEVQATLKRAEATAANARQDVARYSGLIKDRAISGQEYDAALARMRTAEADVAQFRAQLENARLSLSYAAVVAPIAGRAGRAEVTEGALVSAAAATLLTRVEQLDPVYVNFSQSSADLLKVRREITHGVLKVPELRRVAVKLVLEDGSPYPHEGHIDFLDLSIDEQTGTVALRAEFRNPVRLLLPGQFVRAQIQAGVRPDVILVPQRAVALTTDGAHVGVVGPDNVAVIRPVKVGDLIGGSWIVLQGLKSGERVIVDGLQKVQPGKAVKVADSTERKRTAAALATETRRP